MPPKKQSGLDRYYPTVFQGKRADMWNEKERVRDEAQRRMADLPVELQGVIASYNPPFEPSKSLFKSAFHRYQGESRMPILNHRFEETWDSYLRSYRSDTDEIKPQYALFERMMEWLRKSRL